MLLEVSLERGYPSHKTLSLSFVDSESSLLGIHVKIKDIPIKLRNLVISKISFSTYLESVQSYGN